MNAEEARYRGLGGCRGLLFAVGAMFLVSVAILIYLGVRAAN